MKKVLNEINKLIIQLDTWNREYYIENNSSVSDAVYDAAMEKLKQLEKDYPKLISPNSPTQKVGGYVAKSFDKYEHRFPMLSLNNAFNLGDLELFENQIKINNFDKKYLVEPKIDGLSMALIYKKGNLVKAATRGDGITGEDITNNALAMQNIPFIIDDQSDYLEIRGEAYFPLSRFEKINKERKNTRGRYFFKSS